MLPKRWVVERTFGWINRARRLAKDFEATIESPSHETRRRSPGLARLSAADLKLAS